MVKLSKLALLALGTAEAAMPSANDTRVPGSMGLVANGKLPLVSKIRGHWELSGNVYETTDSLNVDYKSNGTHIIYGGILYAEMNGAAGYWPVPHPPEPQSPAPDQSPSPAKPVVPAPDQSPAEVPAPDQSPSPAQPEVPAPAATPAQPLSQPKTQSQTLPWWSWTEKDSKIFGGAVGGLVLLIPLLYRYRNSINRSIDRCLLSRTRNDIESSIVPESFQVRYPPNTHNFIAMTADSVRGANPQDPQLVEVERAVFYIEERPQQPSKSLNSESESPPLNSESRPLPSAPPFVLLPTSIQQPPTGAQSLSDQPPMSISESGDLGAALNPLPASQSRSRSASPSASHGVPVDLGENELGIAFPLLPIAIPQTHNPSNQQLPTSTNPGIEGQASAQRPPSVDIEMTLIQDGPPLPPPPSAQQMAALNPESAQPPATVSVSSQPTTYTLSSDLVFDTSGRIQLQDQRARQTQPAQQPASAQLGFASSRGFIGR